MTRQTSKGKCGLCGGTFNKAAMTKHLKSCKQKRGEAEKPSGSRSPRKTKSFHLVVEGRYEPEYWMHLEIPANAKLQVLDSFLRQTWLECCGHLSVFKIQGERHSSWPMEEYGEEGMDAALREVLSPGMKFYHEYDFGTTTELTLRVVSEGRSEIKGKSIRLLARNDPPSITCDSCGKIATQVCTQCVWSSEGWLCDECAGEHECGEEMFLPVVNSPRVGMCGYTG
jgi:hypothetical protein